MSEEGEDKESKTEQPSHKRLEEAIEKGQVPYSREVTSFLMILALSVTSIFLLPITAKKLVINLRQFIEYSGDVNFTPPGLSKMVFEELNQVLLMVIPAFIFIVLVVIFSAFIQHGQFLFATDQIMPKFSRISLPEGLKRLFSFRSVSEFLKGILKVSITACIIYFVVIDDIKIMALYPDMDIWKIIKELFTVVKDILISITILMFVISIADLFYQKYEHIKNLMMSRQELKEEYKQMEGHPEVKKKQRQLMQSKSKNRMMANVPKADVVITNPEHYSIALQYKQEEMSAPIIVAKGMDLIALKIREIATENDIPIIPNPPLARALYKIELDQPIPVEHYEAVAEVISYLYKLKNKKS